MAARRHFVVLDSLRGVCALLVCAFHFPASGWIIESGFVRHSNLFVDFFFVLSGFVIAANYIDRVGTSSALVRFMWLRIGRLFPLHLAIFLAYLGYELLKFSLGANDAFTGDKQVGAIPTNLLLIHSLGLHDDVTWNRPSWSISCELFAYVTFAIATLASGRLRNLMYALITASAFVVLAYFNDGFFLATHDFGFFRCLAGFFMGVFAWRLWKLTYAHLIISQSGSRTWLGLEIAMLALVFAFVSVVPTSSQLNFLAPLVFGAAVYVFGFEGGRISELLKHRVVTFLGMLSYSIYMTHQFLIDRLLNVARVFGDFTSLPALVLNEDGYFEFGMSGIWADLSVLGFLGLTICVSYVTYRLIEAPARDFFRKHAPEAKPILAKSGNSPSVSR